MHKWLFLDELKNILLWQFFTWVKNLLFWKWPFIVKMKKSENPFWSRYVHWKYFLIWIFPFMVIFVGTLRISLSPQGCIHVYLPYTSNTMVHYVNLMGGKTKNGEGSLYMVSLWLCTISTRSCDFVDWLHSHTPDIYKAPPFATFSPLKLT
jgi:hypothetical protein